MTIDWLNKARLVLVLLHCCAGLLSSAQASSVIDHKGTLHSVTSNTVTTSITAPVSPVEGDVWIDNSDPNNLVTAVYDGTFWASTAPAAGIVAAGKVNSDGTVPRPLFNAIVSRVGTGLYDITFTNPRPTADYAVMLSIQGGSFINDPEASYEMKTINGFRVFIGDSDNGATAKVPQDREFMFGVVDF